MYGFAQENESSSLAMCVGDGTDSNPFLTMHGTHPDGFVPTSSNLPPFQPSSSMYSLDSDTTAALPSCSMVLSPCHRRDDFAVPFPFLNQAGGFVGDVAETSRMSFPSGSDAMPYQTACMRDGPDTSPYWPAAKRRRTGVHNPEYVWLQDQGHNSLAPIARTRRNRVKTQVAAGTDIVSMKPGKLNPSREQANSRERERTQNINRGFYLLSMKVPRLPSDKLCKRQILNLAICYITFLQNMAKEDYEWNFDDHPWPAGTLLTHERLSNAFCMSRLKGAWGR